MSEEKFSLFRGENAHIISPGRGDNGRTGVLHWARAAVLSETEALHHPSGIGDRKEKRVMGAIHTSSTAHFTLQIRS